MEKLGKEVRNGGMKKGKEGQNGGVKEEIRNKRLKKGRNTQTCPPSVCCEVNEKRRKTNRTENNRTKAT